MSARTLARAAAAAAVLLTGATASIAAAPTALAATCTQTTASGNCDTSTPTVYHDVNGAEEVAQDVWNTPPNWSTPAQCAATPSCQTLTATDGANWTVAANFSKPGEEGSVKSYPDTRVTYTLPDGSTPPLANFGSTLISSWGNIHPAGTGIWEYAYDYWTNPAGQQSWGGSLSDEETMVWTDNHGQTPAGSDTGTAYTDAAGTSWEVWADTGPSSTSSAYSIITFVRTGNAQTGSADLMGFMNYEITHGYMNANASFDQIDYGPEICSTFGANETFGLNAFTLVKNGSGGGGGGGPVPPTATTDPATSVTATGAQLNGHVDPEGTDTAASFEYGPTAAYGTTVAATPAGAGSGTASVAESAALTGLAPSTTYHYRIDASSTAGTAQGTDATFTTPAAGGGGTSVAFDSQGSGSKTGTSPLQWTQTIGTGPNRALLAEATVGVSSDTGCTQSMTDNGIVMTKLAVIHTNGKNAGFMDIWSWNVVDHGPPPSGVNTLKMTVSGCASPTLTGTSQSFTGVAHLGTVAAATGYSASAQETLTAPAGDMIAGFAAAGNSISAPAAPAVHSLIRNVNSNTGAGNSGEATAAGTGSAVTFAWPVAGACSPACGDYWAAGLMDLAHA